MQTIFSSRQLARPGFAFFLQGKSASGKAPLTFSFRRFFSENEQAEVPEPQPEGKNEHINPAKIKTALEFKNLLKCLEISEEQLALLNKAVDSISMELDQLPKIKSEKVEPLTDQSPS